MSHYTAVQLLKNELKDAEKHATEIAAQHKDTIYAGERAQGEVNRANQKVSDLKASIALLEKPTGQAVEG
jgi:hypothetical protein